MIQRWGLKEDGFARQWGDVIDQHNSIPHIAASNAKREKEIIQRNKFDDGMIDLSEALHPMIFGSRPRSAQLAWERYVATNNPPIAILND